MVDRIKATCAEKGISVSKLERTADIKENTIWRWDRNTPSIDKVVRVANVLGVSVDYLMGRTEIKETANDGGLPDDVTDIIRLMRSDPRLKAFVIQQVQTYKNLLAAPAADSK